MTRSLILAAAALTLSGAAASAQTVYVSPGYIAPPYVAPTYVAPAYVAPPPVYVAPSAPIYGYGYAPGVVNAYDSYTVVEPGWGW